MQNVGGTDAGEIILMRKLLLGPILIGLLPAAASAAGASYADYSGIYIGPVVDLGFDGGGDKVAVVGYTDGSHQNINAGEGGLIAAGAHLRLYKDSPFDIKATFGYKYVTTEASNVDIHMSRLTYEITPNVRLPYGIWAGIGYVHHSAINFNSGGLGPDLNFKDANGANIELGWRSRTRRHVDFGVAAVYTLIDYQDEYGNDYNANSIGIRFTMNFGWTVFGHGGSNPYSMPQVEPQIAVVPAQVFPQGYTDVAVTPPMPAPPMSTALAIGQTVTLSAARNLRRQPREDSPLGNSLPAGTAVTLDGQIGTFWFVKTASTLGWLRADELQ